MRGRVNKTRSKRRRIARSRVPYRRKKVFRKKKYGRRKWSRRQGGNPWLPKVINEYLTTVNSYQGEVVPGEGLDYCAMQHYANHPDACYFSEQSTLAVQTIQPQRIRAGTQSMQNINIASRDGDVAGVDAYMRPKGMNHRLQFYEKVACTSGVYNIRVSIQRAKQATLSSTSIADHARRRYYIFYGVGDEDDLAHWMLKYDGVVKPTVSRSYQLDLMKKYRNIRCQTVELDDTKAVTRSFKIAWNVGKLYGRSIVSEGITDGLQNNLAESVNERGAFRRIGCYALNHVFEADPNPNRRISGMNYVKPVCVFVYVLSDQTTGASVSVVNIDFTHTAKYVFLDRKLEIEAMDTTLQGPFEPPIYPPDV